MYNTNDFIRKEDVMNLIQSKIISGCLEFNGKSMVDAYDLIDEIYSMPTLYDIEKDRCKAIAQSNSMVCRSNDNVLDEVTMVVIKDGGME